MTDISFTFLKNDVYNFYLQNEELFVDCLESTYLFIKKDLFPYNLIEYPFLKNYSEDVQEYLQNKIICGNKNLNIKKFDSYIDIIYFINNPPIFLRSKKFDSSKIDNLNKDVAYFNYDFSKINYLEMKLCI